MSETLSKVWSTVKPMIKDGLSIIPVRDKQEGNFAPKTAYNKWKEFQNRIITEGELWALMEEKKTEAVAVVCGEISGNLEIIDIDSKYYDGISIRLFKEIRSLRPDLYDKLRVHKTPSGGYHILYRISDRAPEGNQKLAERFKTVKEIEDDLARGLKRPQKKVAFLETRGTGGYALIPPAMGYSLHIEKDIPVLTWADRCELIAIAKSFNEVAEPVKTPKKTKLENTIYEESPWDDYNSRGDVIALLESHGWTTMTHETPERYYFTRPGKKDGVSGTLTKTDKKFYSFTVSTELEPEKTYKPVDLLLTLDFNGNTKECYKWLIDHGYGRVKPKVEKSIIKRQAIKNGALPKNFSEEAVKTFDDLRAQLVENMPYGIFWETDPEKPTKYVISREDLYNVSDQLGFKIYGGSQLVKISGNIISMQDENDYFNTIKEYVWEEEADIYKDICNALESFLQRSGKFTISRLKKLDKNLILKDERDTAYKYFNNGYIEITAKGVKFHTYNNVDKLIWEHKVQNRDWNPVRPESSLYEQFLSNSVGITPYTKRVIGYLSHDHKLESSGYIVVLTEKVPDPKDGGGSGKNIFGNMLGQNTTIKTVPGSSVKFDDRFFAAWNFERIYFLADIPRKIDWPFLKEMATGTGYVNKKYVAEFSVDTEDMPKILLNTNFSFDDSDGGLKRRIRALEFSPYYTVNGGVDTVHKKLFPVDFDSTDWAGYDHFIAESLQELFKADGKIELIELSTEGWLKKFSGQYGEFTFNFIDDNIKDWSRQGFVSNSQFNEQYDSFARDMDIPEKYRISPKSMAGALKEYSKKHNIEIEVSTIKKINSINYRGKTFGDIIQEEEETDPF